MINIGDLCCECRNDTSFGSGKFINRIPCFRETEEGYLCEECYTIEIKVNCEVRRVGKLHSCQKLCKGSVPVAAGV